MNLRKMIAFFAILTIMSGTAFAAATSEAAQPQEVTLKWLGIGPGIQRDAEDVWALWNEELQSHLPGVTVEFEMHPPYEYADRFKLAMAANEQIDVANRMWMMNFFQEIDRGALMPLNDLLDEYGQGIVDAVPEFALNTVTFDGNIYNIPTSWAADWRPGFRFHKELADKTGMEEKSRRIADSELGTPEVYDLLESYLKQAQEDGVLGTGISPTLLSWVWGKGYEGAARGVSIRQDGSDFELVNIYETDSFRTVIQVAADWFAKGYIRKDYLGTDIQELRKDDGKPLGEGAVVWVHLYDPTKSEEETARYGIPIVVYSGAKQAFVGHSPGPNNLAIPTTAKHPQQAMQVINLLFTERDVYVRLTYGIDGKHYKNRMEHDFEPIGYTGIQGSEDSPYGLYPWAVGKLPGLHPVASRHRRQGVEGSPVRHHGRRPHLAAGRLSQGCFGADDGDRSDPGGGAGDGRLAPVRRPAGLGGYVPDVHREAARCRSRSSTRDLAEPDRRLEGLVGRRGTEPIRA